MMFDEAYFKNIWGTVHRHDYCDNVANLLIKKFGVGRYLDIGTGCGFLVKTLREKGCEAFGLEISEYAINNSHGNVIQGTVLDIPFKDNYFSLIHSQGLWEYVPENKVDEAFNECKRVGEHQYHNFDALDNDNPPEHQKITIKTREWWDEKKIGINS